MIGPFYDYKTGFSQTYFLSRVVKDAKRSPKISFFIRKNGLDALRWTNPIAAVILQISRITSLLAALRALARLPLPRLSSRGSFPGSPFCHCGWHGPNREHSVLDPQRLDPTHPGPHRLPSSRHVEDFSVALQSQATPKSATGPRPTPSRTLPALGPSLQRHCRCRYHHTDHLRFSRRHSAGLHPQKTPWPAFLCPDPLQRGAQRFESGNGAQSRQHARLLWGLGFSGADFGEAALLDRFHSHPRSARWRLLRQKDRRIPRSKAPRLRHRCQNVPTVEEQDGPSSIPSVRPRLGGSRVYLHSLSLESRAPIRGRAKACGSGARRDPETAFHLQGLHLPPSFEVTNLELTPEAVWRFYCDRAFQELLLREFKGSYAMAKIPTRSFWANATYMEMLLWAYDLVLAFQFLCLPKTVQHWNISTLRRELWWLPAEWVKHGRRNILWLPARYPRQHLFLKIQQATSKLRPLI